MRVSTTVWTLGSVLVVLGVGGSASVRTPAQRPSRQRFDPQ